MKKKVSVKVCRSRYCEYPGCKKIFTPKQYGVRIYLCPTHASKRGKWPY